MFNNILIIGCGLIGSSILKASIQKKISKNLGKKLKIGGKSEFQKIWNFKKKAEFQKI